MHSRLILPIAAMMMIIAASTESLLSAAESTAVPPAGEFGKVSICLVGDSTVAEKSGWGPGFQNLLAENVNCTNLAKGGRSSRSFRAEGSWQKCLDLSPDFVLIQFGHNDQPGKGPERESAADGAFRDHLRQYVDEARAAGIQPILITSLTRRRWSEDQQKIQPTLQEYADATKAVAEEKQVPLLDLHRLSIQQCERIGALEFRALEPMNEKGVDHTHLNPDGSRAVGQIVASELIQIVPELASAFSAEKIAAAVMPQPYRREIRNRQLHLLEDDSTITIRQNDKTVLVYNKKSPPVPAGMDARYHRSGFLHPVASPAGGVVTATFPADHPHQHGIFSAWVQTTWNDRKIDFWNLAGGTGRVLHQRVLTTFDDCYRVGFEVDLVHRTEEAPIVDILRERWRITAWYFLGDVSYNNGDDSYHWFDLETTQEALTDIPLIVHKYHYGGMALRGPVTWLTPKDGDPATKSDLRLPSEFLNDLGSDRIKGNHEHARWVSLTGESDGRPVTVTVLCHPENFRAPQAARIHPTKPYFTFAPCVDDQIVIDREHPLHGRYRYLITDSAPDPAWINDQWENWQWF